MYAGIPRHTVPAFFLKCVVLQLTMKYSRTIPPSKYAVLQPLAEYNANQVAFTTM